MDSGVVDAAAITLAPRPTLRRKLLLFLSADIVGSTAYKQRSKSSSDWFDTVGRFYRYAETTFLRFWKVAQAHNPETKDELFGTSEPVLWKTIGDEVLFTKEIDTPSQAAACMQVWLNALKEYREFLAKADPALDIKSTAWLADFPISNREIILRVGNDEDDENFAWANDRLLQEYEKGTTGLTRDFVGPAIDTGFRLGAASSTRQLMLSVELAHLLSGEECGASEKYSAGPYQMPWSKLRYSGRQTLKGVMNGLPYPQLWIDANPTKAINKAEDVLIARPEPRCEQIHAFTTAFIEEHPTKFCTGLSFAHGPAPAAYMEYCKAINEQILADEKNYLEHEQAQKERLDAAVIPESSPAKMIEDIDIPGPAANTSPTLPVAE
ncbi:hypothetical protein [Solilutibacter silvestris]|uniref:Uncharacterized protein n=1 Tax=Solilutibacter silvestris TaxID=1645665 RepID=A0A2K1Q1E8_9GAMM|nr:hypothetical protein [Lysobacter silvestris]PNS08863.1 hypothetical protein Lysil_0492 [Lysobacter silvestris]